MENLIKILTEQDVKQLILETRKYLKEILEDLKNSKACVEQT